MSTQLAPQVSDKLQEFAQRRFRLRLVRVVCVLLTALIPAISLVAFCDWGWVLTDQLRWILSATAYGLSAVLTWWLAGRPLLRRDSTAELAAQLESTDPALREQLRAAVELSTDTPDQVPDSATFRSLLQQQVGQQMEEVAVSRSLPVSLMKRWLQAAFVVVVVVACVLLFGGPRLRTLAVRAMLPMANIDRVSRIQVEVLAPTPHSQMIPMDETVAVVVATSGGQVGEAILEVQIGEQPPEQIVMRQRAEGEFAANLHVDAERIEYRILAGDAVTRRHTISGHHRPSVTQFEKRIRYPEYTRQPDETRIESTGDLIALGGSQIDLSLTLNQRVSVAELHILRSGQEQSDTVTLDQQADGTWRTTVPVEDAALYQVHLVSATTQFENPFSPRYEIRPIPDLIPRAGFVDQQQTQLLLPPNDILALRGMAEDDLPLESLQQEFSINGTDWVSVPLEVSPLPAPQTEESQTDVHRVQTAWNWDLLGLNLQTGDQITTRLVATDRRGNRGESIPLQIVVSAPDFNPDRHKVLQQRASLMPAVEQFAATVKSQQRRAEEVTKKLREAVRRGGTGALDTAQTKLDVETLRECATRIETAGFTLLDQINTLLAELPPGTSAFEVDLTGRAVARISYDFVGHIRSDATDLLASTDIKEQRPWVAELNNMFQRAGTDAEVLSGNYQHFISADILNALATDMLAIRQQQELVLNAPTQSFERLRRLETVVLNQLREVADLAESQRADMPDFLVHHLNQLVDWAGSWEGRLDQAMESADRLPELQRHVKDLTREINDRQRYAVIDGGLPGRLVQARNDLDNRSGTLMEPLNDLATDVAREIQLRQQAEDASDTQSGRERTTEADQFAQRASWHAGAALEQLRTRRRLSQSRLDSDRQFAADAGLAHRAVSAILAAHRDAEPADSTAHPALLDVTRAWRVLETGHDFAHLERLVATLMESERWNALKSAGRFRHPNDWEAITGQLDQAIRKLPLAGLHGDVVHQYQQMRWTPPMREADRKLKQRRWQRERIVSASADLSEVHAMLSEAHVPLHAAMAAARAVIAQYAPTIPELAREIAADIRQLEESSTEAADAIGQSAPAGEQLADLQREQDRVNEELEMLLDAMVEDANQQDVAEQAQRERARDADTAIAMIEAEAAEMNLQLDQAQQAAARDQANQTAQELAEAAEQQERTASTLEQLAEHFNRMDAGEDIALSRAELRQAERDMGIARQLDQQFTPVNSSQTPADAQSRLEELEQELQRNPAMQQALSEIAQETVQEAASALEDAARQEREIQQANERSDQRLQQQKDALQKSLKDLGQQAEQLGRTMVNQAKSAADQGKSQPASDQLERAQQRLEQAARTANTASNADLLRDLQQKAADVKKAVDDAAQALDAGRQAADQARQTPTTENARQQQDQKRSAESLQKRLADQLRREADQNVRNRDNRERQEATNVRNAERNEKQITQQLKRIEQQSQKQPDNQSLKNQIGQLTSQLERAQTQTEAIRARREQAQQAENEARQRCAELNDLPAGSLDDENPMAQLSERLAAAAQKRNEQLQQKAAELAEQLEDTQAGAATPQQLAEATDRQQGVQRNVEDTAERVARAARHEARLNNESAAQQLQQQADAIKGVATDEVEQAERQLAAAAKATEQAAEGGEGRQDAPLDAGGDSQENDSATAAAAVQQTQQANAAVAQSEEALQAQAGTLSELQAGQQAASSPSAAEGQSSTQSGQPQSGQPQSGQPQSGQPQSGQPQSGQPQSGQPQSGQPQSGQPSFTPQQAAQGQQLAQALDELDRQTSGSETSQTPSESAAAMAAAAASMAQQRSLRQQASSQAQSSTPSSPNGFDDQSEPSLTGPQGAFRLTDVNRRDTQNWGQLRARDAEDTVSGGRAQVSEEYRRSVEAYFKVLSRRSRQSDSRRRESP
ncbi:MAG: hypothetical protein NXI04_13320 [Planctomycetaceae bacterium]|nr:hypothetical protein [Planctomycetaceae bacterium]